MWTNVVENERKALVGCCKVYVQQTRRNVDVQGLNV